MKHFRLIFPYLITILLWQLSGPTFNPFGILSLVPVFYYMYVRPMPYWLGFGLFMSFMLDYNAETLFLFSSAFLIINALNEMYGIIENERGLKIRGYNTFLAISMLMFLLASWITRDFMFTNLIAVLWLFAWLSISYFPLTYLFKKVGGDR